jgi:hypothetical protein
MARWKKELRYAAAAATDRLSSRSESARKSVARLIEAYDKSLRSLLSAFADGLIDDGTFKVELADQRRAFLRELGAMKGVPKQSGRAAGNTFFDAVAETALATQNA